MAPLFKRRRELAALEERERQGDEKTYVVDFGYEIPIRVVGFLHDVPRFVRHALDGFAWALTEGVHGRQVSPYIEW